MPLNAHDLQGRGPKDPMNGGRRTRWRQDAVATRRQDTQDTRDTQLTQLTQRTQWMNINARSRDVEWPVAGAGEGAEGPKRGGAEGAGPKPASINATLSQRQQPKKLFSLTCILWPFSFQP